MKKGFFGTIAVNASVMSLVAGMALAGEPLQERTHFRSERMAAWHSTQVTVDEKVPNTTVITYVTDRGTHTDRYMFAKIIPFLKKDGKLIGPAEAKFVQVDDIPGYVRASYMLDGVKVEFEAVPLMLGRGEKPANQQGAALYRIKTTPATEVELHCGGGGISSHPYKRQVYQREDFNEIDAYILINGEIANLKHPIYGPHHVVIATDGAMEIETGDDKAKYLAVGFADGEGEIVVGYGPDFVVAGKNTQVDTKKEFGKVEAYYEELLSSRIETPEPLLNQAFRSAIYNIEYNWYDPIGWIECIHHWASMFHMQHTPAAEWLDQIDRSRKTTLTQAHNLHDSGAAPDMFPGGQKYHAFGGTSQYFTYQISKHWDFTADLDFLKEVTPYLDKVLAQVYEEYDPEGDLLLAWRSQIGQQEDYLHHPFNSTSPSIESINMMRTRLKIAKVLGEERLAADLVARIAATRDALVHELWDPKLGRFLYYKDPQEKLHLDGQYETFCYPAIFNIVDQLDAYTNLRHLRDRLTGDKGEVYCSNNFPNHINGTWGMQAGAAQQPVAAWALGKTGLRNEAFIPLKAVAQWVMNAEQRGAWPEVSYAGTPDYFSPPAAVYIQIMIESIFGLNMDKPNGTLTISPAFPDAWPGAKLNLPKFKADYSRKGDQLVYTVETTEPLKRSVRWLVEPARIKSVKVNGKEVEYTTSPGVDCIELAFESPACTKSEIVVKLDPVEYSLEHPQSVALGQPFEVTSEGVTIEQVIDRSGILSRFTSHASRLTGTINRFLLREYSGFGRIGGMNFARRSFFVLCNAGKGVEFYSPVDITLLPEVEATQLGELAMSGNGAEARVLVRNNTETSISGPAWLDVARGTWKFKVDIPARSEKACMVDIPANRLALLSPGENIATLTLPNGMSVSLKIIASEIYRSVPALEKYLAANLEQIELPENDFVSDEQWTGFRPFRPRHHPPWFWAPETLSGMTNEVVRHPELPVEFKTNGRRLIPVSWTLGQQDYTIDLKGKSYRKLYILVVPYLDSHDMFSPVGRILATKTDGRIMGVRTLQFPGDLDWFWPIEPLDVFATARIKRDDRFGLLPQLGSSDGDWGSLSTPARSDWREKSTLDNFPQPAFWATCLPIDVGSTTLSIVEVNLRKPAELKSLTLSTIGTEPAFGIISVVGELNKPMDILEETPYLPEQEFLPESTLGSKALEEGFENWSTEGDAFSIASVDHLFTNPTFNSLALHGEAATGKAFSPVMTTTKETLAVKLLLHGGDNLTHDEEGKLYIDFIDADTKELLKRHYVHGNHVPRWVELKINSHKGQKLQLVLVDDSDDDSYAWLGITDMEIYER